MRRKKEDSLETAARLLDVAREHFTEHGYAKASMEVIVAEAGVTRGALYHHYGNKQGLFETVVAAVQAEIGENVEREASRAEDPMEQLILGCRAFLEAAVAPAARRILLVDGPAVLGWEVWRRMDEENAMRHLEEQLGLLQEKGYFPGVSVPALTHFLSGALNESALWIAQQPGDSRALEDTMEVILHLLKLKTSYTTDSRR
ncbi:TetR/AcrR family transcriptional regulator [Paenibacillus soyae]|uniref:TetR/AcrR family transcriptional regulator n=1 Tax=Paenibacillus soyae TaxID=2969249 RepID=A0A9X2MSQ2_9BACL|nr:TetR/AcrR family transcriptional regulator [Paenibacillus soyae]MCR2805725.1 TetR/AcrR family transcriptional regulator [Paenibacillus soyae]